MYLTRTAVSVFFMTFCVIQARYTGNTIRNLLADLLDEKLNDIDARGHFHHKRIINGEDVKSNWPWQASLQLLDPDSVEIRSHFCGASILNSRWLLTAGHCFDGWTDEEIEEKLPRLQARLGDKEVQASAMEKLSHDIAQFIKGIDNLDLEEEEMNQLLDWINWEVGFEKVIVHPEYIHDSAIGNPNDIALIKLKKDVPATPDVVSRISAVTLPEQTDDLSWPPVGANCTFKGWGCTEIGGEGSDLMQKANLTILSGEGCNQIDFSIFPQVSFETRICAGNIPTEDDMLDLLVEQIEKNPELLSQYKTALEGMEDEWAKLEGALAEGAIWEAAGSGACPGDSGGPLMCEKDGEWVQAGIASWIMDLSNDVARRFPTVFTRVSRFADWIWETVADN